MSAQLKMTLLGCRALGRVDPAPGQAGESSPSQDLFPGNLGLKLQQEVSFSRWLELYPVNLGAGAAISYTPCGLKKRERLVREKIENK